MASEKETIPKEDKKEEEPAKDTNGEKNGDPVESAKLSLGEIATIDGEIAKAKTEHLQVLHNLFYGKNGTGPQIKRGIRKFAGFEEADKQKKLDQLLTYELPAIIQTATILDLQDATKGDVKKEDAAKAIIDFLMAPSGKTFEEVQADEPEEEPEEEAEEEEEEEEVKPKKKGRGGNSKEAGRPKRATSSRVWANDFGSSEDEEIEEARPRVGRKKRGDDSDSGSDYNPSGGGSDSDPDRRKSARNSTPARPTRGGGRGRRARGSDSEEESEESEEEFSDDEVAPAKKKKPAAPSRGVPKRGAAQRGRKRKQETSEEEVSEDESVEEDAVSDKSEKQKKSPRKAVAPKSTPQKNSKGRPKRAAPPASKKKRKDATSDEEEPEEDGSEDDEPLKKPPKKSAGGDGSPTDDDIKKLLKDILAEANLEEITMKTVCKKVYAHYPNHDLSERKAFIKQTVKSLIAA